MLPRHAARRSATAVTRAGARNRPAPATNGYACGLKPAPAAADDGGMTVPPGFRRCPPAAACLLAALLVAACGGGGDGGGGATAQLDAGSPGSPPPPAAPAEPMAAADRCDLPGFTEQARLRLAQLRAAGADCRSRGRFAPTGALQPNAQLAAAAAGHSHDMATRDYFAHQTPEGIGPGARIAATGYDARMWAENIAAGYADVPAVFDAWLASDGHCANLMHPGALDFGLACVRVSGARYRSYWTFKLGAPR